MALSVVDLYSKILPKTNCKECGFLTCLAFAGMVVSQKHPLKNCPHIAQDILQNAEKELIQQYKEGKWLQKDMAAEALEWAKRRASSMVLEDIAVRIGAELQSKEGQQTIVLPFFNQTLYLTQNAVMDDKGQCLAKNDQTFVYIHITRGGIRKPTGHLKSFKEFPNTVSKVISMENHVEKPLKKAFTEKMPLLEKACKKIGGKNVKSDFESADLAFEFRAFPKVPLLLLFWDAEQGFDPETKLLFDETIIEHMDIESIIFLSEHFVKLLTDQFP